MIVAISYVIGGFILLWVGTLVLGISLGELKKCWHLRAGVIIGVCASIVGLYVTVFIGLLGIIRAIIDYAEQ